MPRRSTTVCLAAALCLPATGCAAGADFGDTGVDPSEANGRLQGRVQVKVGRRVKPDHSGVVVVLQGVPGEPPDATNVVHEIRQIDKTFVPEVSVVLEGTTVSFPNDDRVYHNVFSNSRAATFDLGSYKSGTTKEVQLKRPGVVEVFCNVHPDMAAKVLVVDTAYYDATDRAGRFSIRQIPPGTYKYQAWQAWGPAIKGKVTIEPGETTELNLTLSETKKPLHRKKDGSDYGRYQ